MPKWLSLAGFLFGIALFFVAITLFCYEFWHWEQIVRAHQKETFEEFRKRMLDAGEKLNHKSFLFVEDFKTWRGEVIDGIARHLARHEADRFAAIVDIVATEMYPLMEKERHKNMDRMLSDLKSINAKNIEFQSNIVANREITW
jgi:hypothetical protein